MRPICLVDQPFGLGDICFMQKIADYIIKDGYAIEWPVIHNYRWLRDYIVKEHLTFYPQTSTSLMSGGPPDLIMPFSKSGEFYSLMPAIISKYKMMNMSYEGWQDHFEFRRNREKEEQLMTVLGLKGKRYNLVSRTINTPPNETKLDVKIPDNGLPTVNIFIHGEFTPFDWASVIENATNLYFIDSSFTFICEKLALKAEEMWLVSRGHGTERIHESALTLHAFRKPWKLLPPMSS